MKLQHQIVTNIAALLNEDRIPEEELDISPTNYTHSLSVVQFDDAEQHHNKANNNKKEREAIICWNIPRWAGLAPLAL